ncbi:hypothetical protein [Staphylococcus argenteus]|uniref:hypothetical protein n=1 Tax=Staphylococcus argenteus TaxID=985002 RepID=UPI001FBA3929|nr:hypothetical protein [Staphylococcus argenteus]GJF99809.1 hypothetical protein SASC253_26070 [Staphylococcus argenteus]GJG15744.1 hypothetical protein SASC262_26120 [Staphylococcus argenteus]GJG18384.1 hypothetical protein SASC264_26090 [Staphylococcus argenteus]
MEDIRTIEFCDLVMTRSYLNEINNEIKWIIRFIDLSNVNSHLEIIKNNVNFFGSMLEKKKNYYGSDYENTKYYVLAFNIFDSLKVEFEKFEINMNHNDAIKFGASLIKKIKEDIKKLQNYIRKFNQND